MDWKKLYFGKVARSEVFRAVDNEEWQKVRLSMKGVSLTKKYEILSLYLKKSVEAFESGDISANEMRRVEIRITNYVTALSRGGLIEPEDYR
jgi:hypothetical protein